MKIIGRSGSNGLLTQILVVTGCSSGLGAAFAKHVHSSGHNLVATARKVDTLDYIPNGENVLKLSLDITSQQSIDAAYEAALRKFGRIDFLVNNAGYNKMGVTEAVPESDLRDMFETNYWGAVRMTTKVLPIFREENKATGKIGGTVIQVSSIGGRMAYPASAGYHSS